MKTLNICQNCNKEFLAYTSETRKYCSHKCYYEGKPKVRVCPICKISFKCTHGRNSNFCSKECGEISKRTSRMTGETKACQHCSKKFYVSLTSKKARFCSMECYHENRWNGTRTELRQCKFCQKEFECKHSSKNVTCSKRCSKLHRSQFNQGEKSRFWRGGKVAPYHTEWKTYRRLALERDGYKCTRCGGTDRIQVHHINPYRYSQSHELSNLTTLCRSCHSSEEYKVNKLARDAFKKVQALNPKHIKVKQS